MRIARYDVSVKQQSLSFNGAATFQLRIECVLIEGDDDSDASMEPQLFSCGLLSIISIDMVGIIASMEPQLFSCGLCKCRWWWLLLEKLLQWSRNFSVADCRRRRRRSRKDTRGFNGAATFQLRIVSSLDSVHSTQCTASMEPQLFSCGLVDSIVIMLLHFQCFNGAATFQLRIELPIVGVVKVLLVASMEPQLFSCGLNEKLFNSFLLYFASMEPQLFSCGLNTTVHSTNNCSLASMEPQLFSCGLS